MRIEVHQKIAPGNWPEIVRWMTTHYDEIKIYDAATIRVNKGVLDNWSSWAGSLSDTRPVMGKFEIEGDEDLLMWFRLKFL